MKEPPYPSESRKRPLFHQGMGVGELERQSWNAVVEKSGGERLRRANGFRRWEVGFAVACKREHGSGFRVLCARRRG
jgi:hypothetical protein